jgi:phosphoribosylformylglycinamidine cyclo-ligase
MLPDGLQARIVRETWPRAPIFEWLQKSGNVADDEMHRVFNCGIGMVLAVAAKDVDATIAQLAEAGETAYAIGEVVPRADGTPRAVVV